jgi:hypothetical protein
LPINLSLSFTQSVAKRLADDLLHLARVGANRPAPDRMNANVDLQSRRVALVEHGFHACLILEHHVSSPSFQKEP